MQAGKLPCRSNRTRDLDRLEMPLAMQRPSPPRFLCPRHREPVPGWKRRRVEAKKRSKTALLVQRTAAVAAQQIDREHVSSDSHGGARIRRSTGRAPPHSRPIDPMVRLPVGSLDKAAPPESLSVDGQESSSTCAASWPARRRRTRRSRSKAGCAPGATPRRASRSCTCRTDRRSIRCRWSRRTRCPTTPTRCSSSRPAAPWRRPGRSCRRRRRGSRSRCRRARSR